MVVWAEEKFPGRVMNGQVAEEETDASHVVDVFDAGRAQEEDTLGLLDHIRLWNGFQLLVPVNDFAPSIS